MAFPPRYAFLSCPIAFSLLLSACGGAIDIGPPAASASSQSTASSVALISSQSVASSQSSRASLPASSSQPASVSSVRASVSSSLQASSAPPAITQLKIEAEAYTAFQDADPTNQGGAFRMDAVDIEATQDVGGGYNVGWTQAGEWLSYPITLSAGEYRLKVRVASMTGGAALGFSVAGQPLGSLNVPATGGWQQWQTLEIPSIKVMAGQQTLKMAITAAGVNLNWLEFTLVAPAVDTDGDGVWDTYDACPASAPGEKVDDTGCKIVPSVNEVAIVNNRLVGGAGSAKPGFALYSFDNDTPTSSQCVGACAQSWPPVIVQDHQASGALGVGVITRSDGSKQLSFRNKPVYFYAQDTQPSDTKGDGLNGLWHLVDAGSLAAIVPLYTPQTQQEPATQQETPTALITRFSDRGRDRHAKENHFQAYDHFLTFYWENRTISVELIDEVAKGGNKITMNVKSYGKLDFDQAENRWFYWGQNTLAEFCDNSRMTEVVALRDVAHEIYHYTRSGSYNCREGRPIKMGDYLEFEISQFLDKSVLKRGRDNYYGTTYLYLVGKGLVPWDTYKTGPFQAGVALVNGMHQRDSKPIPESAWLGGNTSIHALETAEWDNHYMQMATNINYDNGQLFMQGRRLHHTSFVDGSHNESPDNGIWDEMAGRSGPYVNDRCSDCHVRNGAAAPVDIGVTLDKWIFKVGDGNGNPDPLIGRVLQPFVTGGTGEGTVSLRGWTETNGLRSPNYQFTPTRPVQFSARITPRIVGVGLIDAIPEDAIIALADENDANGDGISGRVAQSVDPKTGDVHVGRFGWKAGAGSLRQQIAGAFNTDMGVMTSLLPKPDCGSLQANCTPKSAPLADEQLDLITKYNALLGVRPQRNYADPVVQQGQALFKTLGCAACHVDTFKTSTYHPLAELRNQTIHPYSDFLLHDMGPGLADNLGEGLASGAEWRTTPLWGVGNQACVTGGVKGTVGTVPFGTDGGETCNPVGSYLHDGRARTLEEAILWHGGEGEAAKLNYQAQGASEKTAVIRFLESL